MAQAKKQLKVKSNKKRSARRFDKRWLVIIVLILTTLAGAGGTLHGELKEPVVVVEEAEPVVIDQSTQIELGEEPAEVIIENEAGENEVVELPVVEQADSNINFGSDEKIDGGKGEYFPTATPQEFANAVRGKCIDQDGYYGSQSLVAGTQILMYNKEYSNVEDLKQGDLIMSGDGKTINTVANNNSTPEKIYEVETHNGYIRGTAGHKVFVNGEAVELQNLEKGMVIDTPKYYGVDLGLSDDEYKFLGMWLGDGTIHYVRDKYPEIIVTVGTDKKVEYMRSLKLDMTERTHSNGRATVFYLKTSEKRLYKAIELMKNKNIPVLSSGSELVIDGFINADGTQRKDNDVIRGEQYVISNTNRQLLVAIQEMAWRNGYTAKLSKPVKREATNYSSNPKDIYRLSINKNPQRNFERGKVLNVVDTGEVENVYHLNVYEDNHSYIADGLSHHNCWDLSDALMYNLVGRHLSTCGTGAAKGIMNCAGQNAGEDFEIVTDKTKLQVGDIAVFDGGRYGHTGMVMGEAVGDYVALLSANQGGGYCDGGGASVNVVAYSTKNFTGAFRYKPWIKVEPPKTGMEVK